MMSYHDYIIDEELWLQVLLELEENYNNIMMIASVYNGSI